MSGLKTANKPAHYNTNRDCTRAGQQHKRSTIELCAWNRGIVGHLFADEETLKFYKALAPYYSLICNDILLSSSYLGSLSRTTEFKLRVPS